MTDTQMNTSRMWDAVNTVLQRYAPLWASRLPFAAAVARLRQSIDELHPVAIRQQQNNTGIAEDKNALELKAAYKADYIGDIIQAYALDEDSMELYRAMNFSAYTLVNLREEATAHKMHEVLQKAKELKMVLAPYGLLPDDIAALDDLLRAYEEKRVAPRDAIVQKSSATKSIGQIIKDGNAQLYRMDKLIKTFMADDPEFVKEYTGARIIIDAGHKPKHAAPVA